jgi:hypothetical protein
VVTVVNRIPHQVQAVTLQVEVLSNGAYRLSTPHARGWAAVAASPRDLVRALGDAFTEVQVASYARMKGEVYDLDKLTMQVPGDALAASAAGRVRRPARQTHSPADWSKLVDQSGTRWRSPSGRLYRENTRTVRNMVAKRAALGLPT